MTQNDNSFMFARIEQLINNIAQRENLTDTSKADLGFIKYHVEQIKENITLLDKYPQFKRIELNHKK